MAEVIERHPWRMETVTEDPSIWCEPCGYGATQGSIAAERSGYEVGKPCDTCGTPMILEERSYEVSIPAYVVIRCACRRKLELTDSWLNTCDCGRDYNSSGQELAPRHHWGEETGESYADIITNHDMEDIWGG